MIENAAQEPEIVDLVNFLNPGARAWNYRLANRRCARAEPTIYMVVPDG